MAPKGAFCPHTEGCCVWTAVCLYILGEQGLVSAFTVPVASAPALCDQHNGFLGSLPTLMVVELAEQHFFGLKCTAFFLMSLALPKISSRYSDIQQSCRLQPCLCQPDCCLQPPGGAKIPNLLGSCSPGLLSWPQNQTGAWRCCGSERPFPHPAAETGTSGRAKKVQ